jgi:hypothetical protein
MVLGFNIPTYEQYEANRNEQLKKEKDVIKNQYENVKKELPQKLERCLLSAFSKAVLQNKTQFHTKCNIGYVDNIIEDGRYGDLLDIDIEKEVNSVYNKHIVPLGYLSDIGCYFSFFVPLREKIFGKRVIIVGGIFGKKD